MAIKKVADKPIPIKNNCGQQSYKPRGKLKLSTLAYNLAEAMLGEFCPYWKLGYIDYLIKKDDHKK